MILLQWFGGSLVVGTAWVGKIEIEMRGHVCIKAVRESAFSSLLDSGVRSRLYAGL
jgi:hypothetical protein